MNSDEHGASDELVKDITSGRFPISGVGLLQLSQRLLRKLSPILHIFLLMVSLFIASVFGYKLRDRLINSQESVGHALQSELEPTLHSHEGVASLVLSAPKVPPPDNKDYSVKLGPTLDEIDQKIESSISDAKALGPGKVFASLNLQVLGSGSSWRKVITRTQGADTFLMVPAISIRKPDLTNPPLDTQHLEDALAHNPEVLSDLFVAANIAPLIKDLDGLTVQSLTIVQTYFISEAGVILLRQSNAEDNVGYYKGQFPPFTLFNDRSYFREAVRNSLQYEHFNYRTAPYIDAGGNGVVITYSRAVKLANQRAGIICVDVKLPDAVGEMKKRLISLGAEVGEFSWIIGEGKEGDFPKDFGWFENQLRGQSAEEQARFLGAIAVETDYPPPPGTEARADVISFTIPTGSVGWDKGKRKTTLLWGRVDFASSRAALNADMVGFSAGIVLLVLVSSNIFRDYTVLRRELSKVLKKMSQVMYEASTPFAWLNEKNEFIEVNESFLEVLGYTNEEDLKAHTPTFRGLITAETQPKYDEVLSRSAAGGETGKYEVDVKTKEGDTLHVVIHGERIPYPTFWRRGLPHRFGVFLEWSKKVEPVRPQSMPDHRTTAVALTKHARAQRKTERLRVPKTPDQSDLN